MPAVNNALEPQTAEAQQRVQLLTTVPIPKQSAEIAASTTDNWHGIGNQSVPEVIQPNSPEPDELVQAARESAVEDAQAGRILDFWRLVQPA